MAGPWSEQNRYGTSEGRKEGVRGKKEQRPTREGAREPPGRTLPDRASAMTLNRRQKQRWVSLSHPFRFFPPSCTWGKGFRWSKRELTPTFGCRTGTGKNQVRQRCSKSGSLLCDDVLSLRRGVKIKEEKIMPSLFCVFFFSFLFFSCILPTSYS